MPVYLFYEHIYLGSEVCQKYEYSSGNEFSGLFILFAILVILCLPCAVFGTLIMIDGWSTMYLASLIVGLIILSGYIITDTILGILLKEDMGKRILRLKVYTTAGEEITPKTYLIRNIIKYVSIMFFPIVLIYPFFNEERNTLHDKILGTKVCKCKAEYIGREPMVMDTKSVFKLSFSEEYINKMLNKGWKLSKFRGRYVAVFEKCPRDKYTCKKILVDIQFEEYSKKLKSKLEEMINIHEIEFTSLQYQNCMMLMYYIIYEKEKVISNEILEHNFPIGNGKKYITRGVGKLLMNIVLPVLCVASYIFILESWAMGTNSRLYKVLIYAFIIIVGLEDVNTILNKVRGMILTLYSRKLILEDNK